MLHVSAVVSRLAAVVNSQGREPLERMHKYQRAPKGAAVNWVSGVVAADPPGLSSNHQSANPALTVGAIDFRPSGPVVRIETDTG